jgi:hypothetical protein
LDGINGIIFGAFELKFSRGASLAVSEMARSIFDGIFPRGAGVEQF